MDNTISNNNCNTSYTEHKTVTDIKEFINVNKKENMNNLDDNNLKLTNSDFDNNRNKISNLVYVENKIEKCLIELYDDNIAENNECVISDNKEYLINMNDSNCDKINVGDLIKINELSIYPINIIENKTFKDYDLNNDIKDDNLIDVLEKEKNQTINDFNFMSNNTPLKNNYDKFNEEKIFDENQKDIKINSKDKFDLYDNNENDKDLINLADKQNSELDEKFNLDDSNNISRTIDVIISGQTNNSNYKVYKIIGKYFFGN